MLACSSIGKGCSEQNFICFLSLLLKRWILKVDSLHSPSIHSTFRVEGYHFFALINLSFLTFRKLKRKYSRKSQQRMKVKSSWNKDLKYILLEVLEGTVEVRENVQFLCICGKVYRVRILWKDFSLFLIKHPKLMTVGTAFIRADFISDFTRRWTQMARERRAPWHHQSTSVHMLQLARRAAARLSIHTSSWRCLRWSHP